MAFRIWAFALLSWAAAVTIAADPTLIESTDGVLVLRNGFVLHGRITLQGESYIVAFDGKGEARLPRTEVEFACGNLDEAYRIKRDTLSSDETKLHISLAEWCLRQGLIARAADQLLIVENQNPTHPALSSLERRLESLANPQQVSSAIETTPAGSGKSLPPPRAVTQEIDPPLMQQFTMTVQPILLNRCGIHACHGPAGTTNYRLLRPVSGHATTSRMTHRNLQATLAYIDRNNLDGSRLLEMARQPHGGVATVAYHEKSGNQIDLVTNWVRRLDGSAPEKPNGRAAAATRPATLPPSLTSQTPVMQASPENPNLSQRGDAVANPTTTKPREPMPHSPNPQQKTPGTANQEYTPRDPFDPAIFNRQFHNPP